MHQYPPCCLFICHFAYLSVCSTTLFFWSYPFLVHHDRHVRSTLSQYPFPSYGDGKCSYHLPTPSSHSLIRPLLLNIIITQCTLRTLVLLRPLLSPPILAFLFNPFLILLQACSSERPQSSKYHFVSSNPTMEFGLEFVSMRARSSEFVLLPLPRRDASVHGSSLHYSSHPTPLFSAAGRLNWRPVPSPKYSHTPLFFLPHLRRYGMHKLFTQPPTSPRERECLSSRLCVVDGGSGNCAFGLDVIHRLFFCFICLQFFFDWTLIYPHIQTSPLLIPAFLFMFIRHISSLKHSFLFLLKISLLNLFQGNTVLQKLISSFLHLPFEASSF